jgi:regulator of cell morphogenesis and NO signaling
MNKIYDNVSHPVIEPEVKLFELIDAHPSVVSIFSRLDISLPFGDMSLAEMCSRDRRDVELFMTLCKMHIDPAYRPNISCFDSNAIEDVVGYLRASHRYYTHYLLPHVSRHLDEILSHCDTLSQRVLRNFYDEYMRYILEHFEEEERNIFTVVDSKRSYTTCDCSIMERPHGDIDDRTNDMASLIIKSLPERVPTPLRCAMLKDIYVLRDDMRTHTNIETHLLRPLVERLTNNNEQ